MDEVRKGGDEGGKGKARQGEVEEMGEGRECRGRGREE